MWKGSAYYPLGCAEDMGEGGYQAAFAGYEIDTPGSLNERLGHWRTRNGSVLRVAEMSCAHLGNAIRYFTRAGWGEHEKIGELRKELKRRAK